MKRLVVRFLVCVFALVLLGLSPAAVRADNPYYGFYPSSRGGEFKLFKHNILGFSLDVPTSWTFGVFGKPPLTVALVYPEGLNTAVISDGYEMLEIGWLPFEGLSLDRAKEMVVLGIRQKHKNIEHMNEAKITQIGKNEAIRWKYSWRSKTGVLIVEDIFLIKFGGQVRSVVIRASQKKYDTRLGFYEPIVSSFQPFLPTHQ